MAKTYSEAVKEAIDALEDLEERGDAAIGGTWDELEKEIFTPEEIAASDLRVALIGEFVKARNEKGITQRKLEELSGVRQPIIARIEKGHISPQIETIMKLLAPLGKKLAIVPR
ncbi:MAG: helix-turn-helix domain-containing protein [Schwartzia sp.]|nr:helix-turn-helix domain-containing protein [Schwartzia sp. (in: firmicutes)]